MSNIMRDATLSGRTVIIGVVHEFSEEELATLQNIAEAGGTTIGRVVRHYAARGLDARGDEDGAMDLLFEKATATGFELGHELLAAVFEDWWVDDEEIAGLGDFLRHATDGIAEETPKEDRLVFLSVAEECAAGRGGQARAKAQELFDRGWPPNEWGVGYEGWVEPDRG